MIEKLRTVLWFAARPSFWAHAGALALRKAQPSRDGAEERDAATRWAASQAVSVAQALSTVGLAVESALPKLPDSLLAEAHERARTSAVAMGGAGDLDLLYAAAKLSGATRIVETGVAYGWSSLAILAALEGRSQGRLCSVDMPYPKLNNEAFVGIAVPERLRAAWTLVREPDRNGLPKALAQLGGTVDLCHYDSDKSYYGRAYGFPLMWTALRSGGLFISDDIQDNLAFREFVESKKAPYAVTTSEGKYVGLIVKP